MYKAHDWGPTDVWTLKEDASTTHLDGIGIRIVMKYESYDSYLSEI